MDKRRQWAILITSTIISFFIGVTAPIKTIKMGIGYGYLIKKKGGEIAIHHYPRGEKINNVQSFIAENGLVFGTTRSGDFFCLDKSKLEYFESYEAQLDYSRSRGVIINESKYMKF